MFTDFTEDIQVEYIGRLSNVDLGIISHIISTFKTKN